MRKRLKSFEFALNGLKIALKEEANFRIHSLTTICVVCCGFLFRISAFEWIAVLCACGLVLCMELFNSSIEAIADFVSPQKHNQIKKIKDLSAAAVLTCALVAMVIGLIVFVPKIIEI